MGLGNSSRDAGSLKKLALSLPASSAASLTVVACQAGVEQLPAGGGRDLCRQARQQAAQGLRTVPFEAEEVLEPPNQPLDDLAFPRTFCGWWATRWSTRASRTGNLRPRMPQSTGLLPARSPQQGALVIEPSTTTSPSRRPMTRSHRLRAPALGATPSHHSRSPRLADGARWSVAEHEPSAIPS
jgi:hypothetical protein